MGGRIWFTSEPGKGSVFYFTLSRWGVTAKQSSSAWQNQLREVDLHGIPVLLVEDNAESLVYYREVLLRKGIVVHEASTAKEAWQIFVSSPEIKIVLLDLFLPDKNGLELAIRIKQHRSGLRIIAQTAYASEEDRIKCLRAGCDSYLPKPLSREELISYIAHQVM